MLGSLGLRPHYRWGICVAKSTYYFIRKIGKKKTLNYFEPSTSATILKEAIEGNIKTRYLPW